MFRATRHVAPLALILLLAVACGDHDGEASLPPTDPLTEESGEDTTTTVEEPDDAEPAPSTDAALVGDGACSLLDADWLADTLTFEFGESTWEERPDDTTANRCRWFNDSQLMTLTVDLDDPDRADLDGRRSDPTDGTTVEPLDDLAPGAFAVRDDFGERYFQIWVPLDGAVMSVVADVMQIETDDQFVAVAAEALANSG